MKPDHGPSAVTPSHERTSSEVPTHDLPPQSLRRFLFTADEVAEALAVSTSMVRQLTLTGELPCRRVGRLVRYSAVDIAAFVDNRDERGYHSGSG